MPAFCSQVTLWHRIFILLSGQAILGKPLHASKPRSSLTRVCQTDEQRSELLSSGGIPMGIGRNSIVRKAIVDKNARIGENVKVHPVSYVCSSSVSCHNAR